MFRLFLAGILLWLTFDWFYSVIRMFQTDNIYLTHEIATHASSNAWLMLIVVVLLVLDYRWSKNNE